jgi:hypothetical protein
MLSYIILSVYMLNVIMLKKHKNQNSRMGKYAIPFIISPVEF